MKNLSFSGDALLIDQNQIVKICQTDQVRFLKNIEKQKTFNNPHINSVPIVSQGIIDDKNYVTMPYLKCHNSMLWISVSGIDEINQVINIFCNYFKFLIEKSKLKNFKYSDWISKIEDVKRKIQDQQVIKILEYLEKIKFSNLFYYGDYHGDLTLSNLFITNEGEIKIEAFDFLETYIHSPINDLIKLRQDTKHLWTLNLINDQTIDKNKVVMILNHIDKSLEKIIDNDSILSEFYVPMQILNLIRILPYSKEQRITNYLKKEIKELFDEINCNNAVCR